MRPNPPVQIGEVISDHILRRYAHQTYQHVVDLCRHNFTRGCSPQANLIFPACLGKCLVSNKSSLCMSCEEFKHSKSFAARARLLQIQIGADCLCRSRALATKAHRFRLVRLRVFLLALRQGAESRMIQKLNLRYGPATVKVL